MPIYSFIAAEQANPDSDWTVAECCRTLEVSRSGYYAWLSREPGSREVSEWTLAGRSRWHGAMTTGSSRVGRPDVSGLAYGAP